MPCDLNRARHASIEEAAGGAGVLHAVLMNMTALAIGSAPEQAVMPPEKISAARATPQMRSINTPRSATLDFWKSTEKLWRARPSR
ncbi:MAG: hypothetical protein RLZZ282_1452 [Verrucomicrobiota bacterium]